jgi:hypothetical protein
VKSKNAVAKGQTLIKPSEANKDLTRRSSADLAEAGYGFFHEFSESVRHFYLVSGEVYRVGKSDLTRIR